MAEEHPQPEDRPRPKYGELAPPGWVWKPPADQSRLDTDRPVPDAPAEAPAGASRPRPGVDAPLLRPQAPAGSSSWNTTLTILLVVFGFFGMLYSVGGLQALPASMQLLHSTNGLGDYTPAPVVGTLVTAGSITMAAIWAVAAGLSTWLLVRRRISFWVPLVAGILAFVVLIVFMSVIVATDPLLINLYSGVTPAPTGPATPSPTPTAPPTTSS